MFDQKVAFETPGYQLMRVLEKIGTKLKRDGSMMVSKAQLFISCTYLKRDGSMMVSKAAQASPIVRLYTNCVGG